MPMYMDIHELPGVTSDAVAKAHILDLHAQAGHNVDYVKYWVNEKQGKIFCLCHAPTAEAADAVHQEAHGLRAARIMEVTPEVAEAFMGAAETDSAGAVLLPGAAEHDPGTRTVMFTDIVGSTSMTQRLGDDVSLAVLQCHDDIVRAALKASNGREVKHTGDGIMAVFYSAASAIRCAMLVQQNIAQHRKDHPDQSLQVRVGVAAGEPIEHHNDFFGSTVQLAARLCAHADPEQILMSNAVAELCIGKSLPLEHVGHVELKGFDQPVHVHCVKLR
ncbi:MAG TPA: nickel-binding protein [Rhizomicrobium sp.]|jgi:class 3 adenylate cyclase|nr:nickel-binding protein [Rhizomicrobium sp.]